MAKRITTNAPKLAAIDEDETTTDAPMLDSLITAHASTLTGIEDATLDDISALIERVAVQIKALAVDETPESRAALKSLERKLIALRDEALDLAEARAVRATLATTDAVVQARAAALASLGLEVSLNLLSPQQLDAIQDTEVLGASVSEWFDARTITGNLRLRRELRDGFNSGQGMRDIAKRVAKVLEQDVKEVTAITRTVIQGVSNEAAVQTYRANADVISGMRWIATLDNRTCPICGPLDGTVLALDSKTAPPAHPQCRCFLSPIVKGFPPSDVPDWDTWMGKKSPEDQDSILGPTEADRFRERTK
jgi:SPP1 gp7 family putative phage head morphogenesis protein